MAGRSIESRPLFYVAILVAILAVVGTVAFGWEWGGDDPVPTVIGVGVALLAIGWTLYSKFAA